MSSPPDLYATLRRKVVENPREAARLFIEEFNKGDAHVSDFLPIISRPPESRLRQLAANALRGHKDKTRVVSEIVRWRSSETDEFTRRALEAFLDGIEISGSAISTPQGPYLGRSADAYRYVATRLRHKLRNAMLGIQNRAEDLKEAAIGEDAGLVSAAAGRLTDAINRIGRMLENTDSDPEQFTNRPISLHSWLRGMSARYATEFSPIQLTLEGEDLSGCQVYGNSYLLETAFWNLWVNAQQAVEGDCRITVVSQMFGDRIEMIVIDNGPGFSDADCDLAFLQQFSGSRSANRGLGLLEVQDAIERLGGKVQLTLVSGKEYRIKITLPLSAR